MKSMIHELISLFRKGVSKKLITTLAIGFTMLSAKADHSSAFKLKLFDNGVFSVVLDDKPIHSKSGIFSKSKVKPGYHKLKVIRFVNGNYGQAPLKQVIYKGWINIPARSVVYASISCHSQFEIEKIVPRCAPSHGNGHGHCNSNNWEEGECGEEEYGWDPAPPMPSCMVPASFMQLKNSIASKTFDSSRLEIAKQTLTCNFLSAAQVAELTRMFSFDSSRLEFAKMAFARTIDRQNYFLVNEAFTFESSIGELNEFIARN